MNKVKCPEGINIVRPKPVNVVVNGKPIKVKPDNPMYSVVNSYGKLYEKPDNFLTRFWRKLTSSL